jgi:hypothetical protein
VGQLGNTIGELWLDKSPVVPVLRVYDGSQWIDAGSGGGGGGGAGSFVRWIYTAIGGETSLSGVSAGVPLQYQPGLEEVFINGALITRGIDYNASSGSNITGLQPLTAGDVVTVTSVIPLSIVQLPGQVTLLRWSTLATAGQTVLSGSDSTSQQLVYTAGLEEVYVNGAFLRRGVDYTATNGSTITISAPLTLNDEITVLAWAPFVVAPQPPGQVTLLRWSTLATAGQTALSGADSSSQQLSYTAGLEEVYVNGAFLRRGVDYTAANGSTITVSTPLKLNDEITVLAWTPFVVGSQIVNADVSPSAGITSNKLSFAQSGIGAVSRSVDSKLKDTVSVKDFGAVGDGVADDTAAIQAALALGGRVYFPATANYYRITDNLVMVDGTTVEGDGWKSEIRLTVQGKNCFVAGNACTVRDLHVKMVDGNNLDLAKQNAIYIAAKKNVTVENNYLELADNAVSGVQVRVCFNVFIKGNTIFGGKWTVLVPGPSAVAADILFYGGAAGGRYIVENNLCLSNNSQGIFFSALGQDYDTVINGNICITLDPTTCTLGGTWAEQAFAGMARRHGILASYTTAAAGTPRLVIDGNVCRNTLWTGIYKQGAANGPVVISNNVCTLNGQDTSNSLGAGIYLYQTGGELITGNTIEDCKTLTSGSGGITVNSAETPAPNSSVISGNIISKCAFLGIALATKSSKVEVRDNLFLDNVGQDIYTDPTGGFADVGGHKIIGNTIRRSSGTAVPGIHLNHANTALVTVVRDNEIVGFNNTNASNLNSGVYHVGTSSVISVRDNRIENFYYGLLFGQYQNATDRDIIIEDNEFRACSYGIAIGSSVSTAFTIPVVNNRFIGMLIGNTAAALSGFVIIRNVQRLGQRLQWETTVAPTQGAWEVGDRSVNTTPAVGQPKAWSCTVAGTPGTWVSEGNL